MRPEVEKAMKRKNKNTLTKSALRDQFIHFIGFSGLEKLFHLSLSKKYELLVEDFQGNKVHARYSSFSVGTESFGYTLHVSGFTDGDAGGYHLCEKQQG